MARKKEPLKPLLATKHDFVASLDNVISQSIMLMQVCDGLIEHKAIKIAGLHDMLVERLKEFREAVFFNDG